MTTTAGPPTTTTRLAVLLFTDLVDSTALKSKLGMGQYTRLMDRYDEVLRRALGVAASAQVVNEAGDSCFITFGNITEAVRFALRFQWEMHHESWTPQPLKTRVGIHLGEITELNSQGPGNPRLVGLAADLASRVCSLASPGQILLSRNAFNEARQFVADESIGNGDAPPQLRWVAHGPYLFKGSDEPLEIFEVGVEGVAPLSPPLAAEKARRVVPHEQEQMLGWRPAAGLAVPQRVGWKLERKLGEGGFGEVWLAVHAKTRQHRVFKFCFDAERLRSFKRELTLFRLVRETLGDRPDIARLYDVKLEEPPFFLESEYTRGGSLLQWGTEQGGIHRVDLATRVRIVAQIAEALAAAHSVGILHKDLKPSNVLIHLDADGTPSPRLTDFGIGVLIDRKQLAVHGITELGFTELTHPESSHAGTLMYTPPEMLADKPFTIQGDIYSLGVMLFQMVVGDLKRPLAEGWERDVEDELLREDIACCVDGDPQHRLHSAIELARRLRRLPQRAAERESEKRAAAVAVRRRRWLRAGELLIVASLLIAVASLMGILRARWLSEAVSGSEWLARQSEREAQRRLLNSYIITGDSQALSQQYDEAATSYGHAWTLAEQLKEPSLGAISSLLLTRGESPPPLFSRRVTALPGGGFSPIARVRMAPSGKLAVAGDGVGYVHVIDLPRGRRIASPRMKGWAYGVAFAMDGAVCLTASSTGQLQSWNVGRWDAPSEEIDAGRFIYALATGPDGRRGAAVEPSVPQRSGGVLHFWALDPLRLTRTISSPNGLLSAAFSPDGKLLATGDEKGTIVLWDVASGTVTQTLAGHGAEVAGVAFAPDGKRLLSGSFDKTLRLWDVAAHRELLRLTGHRGAVHDVRIAPGGRIGASASSDQTIKCWDLESGRELTTFSRHVKGARSLDFLPDGSGLVSSGEDGYVAIWNLAADDRMVLPLHPGGISDVCIARDGLTALSAGVDGHIVQFDLVTGQVLRRTKAPGELSAISLAYDGRSALVGGSHGMLLSLGLLDFKLSPVRITLEAARPLSPTTVPATVPATQPTSFRNALSVVAPSPTAASALISGHEGILALLPLPPRTSGVARRTSGRVMAAAFTPDGTRALVAVERDLLVIDSSSGDVVGEMPRSPRLIAAVAVADDGKTAVTGSYDNTARLWNLQKRISSGVLSGHLGWVRAVAFLPGGQSVVTGSEDNTVRLWDVQTSRELCTFTGHTRAVTALAVSQDGSVILSGSADGTIRKWDLSRPVTYRRMQGDLTNVYTALETRPDDPAALHRLGEWYAFRGRADWAVECLERARAGGAEVSPLMLARAYWKLGRLADAQREFASAAARKEAPAAYLDRCQAALSGATGK